MVVPLFTPYTAPAPLTVPTAVLLLLQAPAPPDAVASVSVIVAPLHTAPGPVIAPAAGTIFTVTIVVAVTVPHDTLDTV